jgi:predicted nucleic-acid-binding Zn-ribbon protein
MQNNTCPKCGGTMNFQASTFAVNKKRHGLLYWLLIGWWLHPLLWLIFTVPMLIYRLVFPNRKQKIITKTVAVCQSCGYTRA